MKRGWELILLIIILAIGGFLRLWNLGVPSLWVDELNSLYAAQSWLEGGGLTLPSGIGYTRASIYSYITGLFFKLFGVSEVSTRLTAVVFGVLSILLVYYIGKKFFNQMVGFFTAFFMAFSHFEIGWSRTARMYTLLQFLSLILVFAFVRAFEANVKNNKSVKETKSIAGFHWIKRFWQSIGISPIWFIVVLISAYVAYFHVHLAIVFLLFGLFLYILFMALPAVMFNKRYEKIRNKYVLASLALIIGSCILMIISPALRGKIQYFLNYTPPWAEGAVTAQNPLLLFEFLISPYRFPLAAFFIIGSLQAMGRFHKTGILLLFAFICPVFLLSFVFTHRDPKYMFHVYPFFLMLAAFGITNIIQAESRMILENGKMWKKLKLFQNGLLEKYTGVLLSTAILVVFFLSPWARISLNIPFNGDGVTNMAVTPNEWRQGTHILEKNMRPQDLMISSLPLTSLYYGKPADYALNWSLLRQAQTEESQNEEGKWVDYYAGVECIQSQEQLHELLNIHERGWIIIEKYLFETPLYTPIEVKNYIHERLGEPLRTRMGTVLIFGWGV